MSNPLKGEATATLDDGRKLQIVLNANAWVEIEEVLGKKVPDILDELKGGNASMKTQRAIIWGGLQKHHPEMTLQDAGEVLVEAAEALAKAVNGGVPQGEPGIEEDEEDEAEAIAPPRLKAGAGTA